MILSVAPGVRPSPVGLTVKVIDIDPQHDVSTVDVIKGAAQDRTKVRVWALAGWPIAGPTQPVKPS